MAVGLLALSASVASAAPYTIVIDAGHGGDDAGATGTNVHEKDINLGVALKLGKLIDKDMKDAKVVYTRSNDRFVTLQGRADIANKASGDLFISIHTNSLDKSAPNRTSICGTSVYTLAPRGAKSNLDVAMRENSVIKLENDRSGTYQGFDPSSDESYIIFEMTQNKYMDNSVKLANSVQRSLVSSASRRDRGVRQGNFWVLHSTAMPSVLIELDFICNPQQEKYLASESGQQELAKAIFAGIRQYRSGIKEESKAKPEKPSKAEEQKPAKKEAAPKAKESKESVKDTAKDSSKPTKAAAKPDNQKKTAEKTENIAKGTAVYKIQFLTSGRKLSAGSPKFKGRKDAECYKDTDGMLKYTLGSYTSEKDAAKALKDIRRDFPDAFVVKFIDGKRIK